VTQADAADEVVNKVSSQKEAGVQCDGLSSAEELLPASAGLDQLSAPQSADDISAIQTECDRVCRRS